MRTATITRHTFTTTEGTFGDYLSDSGFKCITLEPSNKHPCIPAGKYQCELRQSLKFAHRDFGHGYGRVYGIKDVPNRKDILIHPLNWSFESEGCIGPGRKATQMKTPKGDLQMGITSSTDTLMGLMGDMGGKDFTLTILEVI